MNVPAERRIPGWVIVLLLTAVVAAVAAVIVLGPRR
jgi:hypothetical protein